MITKVWNMAVTTGLSHLDNLHEHIVIYEKEESMFTYHSTLKRELELGDHETTLLISMWYRCKLMGLSTLSVQARAAFAKHHGETYGQLEAMAEADKHTVNRYVNGPNGHSIIKAVEREVMS